MQHVCGRDKKYVREVVIDVKIVVAKCTVLLWIEHLKQSRRRIAAKIRTDLVDLIEHD